MPPLLANIMCRAHKPDNVLVLRPPGCDRPPGQTLVYKGTHRCCEWPAYTTDWQWLERGGEQHTLRTLNNACPPPPSQTPKHRCTLTTPYPTKPPPNFGSPGFLSAFLPAPASRSRVAVHPDWRQQGRHQHRATAAQCCKSGRRQVVATINNSPALLPRTCRQGYVDDT